MWGERWTRKATPAHKQSFCHLATVNAFISWRWRQRRWWTELYCHENSWLLRRRRRTTTTSNRVSNCGFCGFWQEFIALKCHDRTARSRPSTHTLSLALTLHKWETPRDLLSPPLLCLGCTPAGRKEGREGNRGRVPKRVLFRHRRLLFSHAVLSVFLCLFQSSCIN